MKTLKVLSVFAVLTMFSCQDNQQQQQTENQTTPPPDAAELLDRWDSAWNQNNADSIQNLFADDAMLLMQGEEYSSDRINQWVNENSGTMRELETDASVENSGDEIAYQAGTYTHGLQENDTLQLDGTFTMIWERQQNDDWKVRLIDISQRQDTTAIQQQQ